eukprot:4348852-Amphidinium_carterae.1
MGFEGLDIECSLWSSNTRRFLKRVCVGEGRAIAAGHVCIGTWSLFMVSGFSSWPVDRRTRSATVKSSGTKACWVSKQSMTSRQSKQVFPLPGLPTTKKAQGMH